MKNALLIIKVKGHRWGKGSAKEKRPFQYQSYLDFGPPTILFILYFLKNIY